MPTNNLPLQNRTVFYLLSCTLLVQFFHYTEHLVQVYQHWWQELPIKASKGILYFLDLEWNHLIFNAAYLILLGLVWIAYKKMHREEATLLLSFRTALSLIGITVFIQSYHVIEHIIRVGMHLQIGCEPCPGILGRFVDGIYLHFAFNTVVFFLPLIAALMLLRKRI